MIISIVSSNIVDLDIKLVEKVVQKKNRFVFSDFSNGAPLKNAEIEFDVEIEAINYKPDEKLKLYVLVAKTSVAYLIQEALIHHISLKKLTVEEIF